MCVSIHMKNPQASCLLCMYTKNLLKSKHTHFTMMTWSHCEKKTVLVTQWCALNIKWQNTWTNLPTVDKECCKLFFCDLNYKRNIKKIIEELDWSKEIKEDVQSRARTRKDKKNISNLNTTKNQRKILINLMTPVPTRPRIFQPNTNNI